MHRVRLVSGSMFETDRITSFLLHTSTEGVSRRWRLVSATFDLWASAGYHWLHAFGWKCTGEKNALGGLLLLLSQHCWGSLLTSVGTLSGSILSEGCTGVRVRDIDLASMHFWARVCVGWMHMHFFASVGIVWFGIFFLLWVVYRTGGWCFFNRSKGSIWFFLIRYCRCNDVSILYLINICVL